MFRSNEKLTEHLGVVNNEHYNISKSRKGINKDKPVKGENDDRSDSNGIVPSSLQGESLASSLSSVSHEPSRKGNSYKKDIVSAPIKHKCDRSKFPDGAVFFKTMKPKVVRTVVNLIEECRKRRTYYENLHPMTINLAN